MSRAGFLQVLPHLERPRKWRAAGLVFVFDASHEQVEEKLLKSLVDVLHARSFDRNRLEAKYGAALFQLAGERQEVIDVLGADVLEMQFLAELALLAPGRDIPMEFRSSAAWRQQTLATIRCFPCFPVSSMSAAKTHDFRDSRGSGASVNCSRTSVPGGIAARTCVPSRWEQAFWARFDAQRATLMTGRVESNSRTVAPKHEANPTTTKHQNTGQSS